MAGHAGPLRLCNGSASPRVRHAKMEARHFDDDCLYFGLEAITAAGRIEQLEAFISPALLKPTYQRSRWQHSRHVISIHYYADDTAFAAACAILMTPPFSMLSSENFAAIDGRQNFAPVCPHFTAQYSSMLLYRSLEFSAQPLSYIACCFKDIGDFAATCR